MQNFELYEDNGVVKLDSNLGLILQDNGREDGSYLVIKNDNIIIDDYIYKVGAFRDKDRNKGYIFILKDYRILDILDKIFFTDKYTDAVIISIGNKLYTNCAELKDKYCYIDSIRVIRIEGNLYIMQYMNDNYCGCEINNKYKVYYFRRILLG